MVGNCSQNGTEDTTYEASMTSVTNWHELPSNTYPEEKISEHSDNWGCAILIYHHINPTHYDCKIRISVRTKKAHKTLTVSFSWVCPIR